MLSAAKHLARSSAEKSEILRLRLNHTPSWRPSGRSPCGRGRKVRDVAVGAGTKALPVARSVGVWLETMADY